ncbi:MAG: site-specific tyrosine recombinase XerD [Candidatus Kapaibacteriales bacterium]
MNKNNFNELVEYFLFYLDIERGFSNNTKYSYNNDLSKFISFIQQKGITELGIVSPRLIQDFLEELRRSKLTSRSIARLLSALKHFYRFLISQNLVNNNPFDFVDTPKVVRTLPEFLTIEEVEKFINIIDVSNPAGIRNRAMVEVLYGCGLRVSELISLKSRDVLFDYEIVRVFGKGNKERIVPIGSTALTWVKEFIHKSRPIFSKGKTLTDILFLNHKGEKFSRMGIWKILHKYAVLIGLDSKVHPHIFRHSFATHMINAGADIRIVQELLGHSVISTTQIYTHLSKDILREVHKTYHPRG